MALHRDFFGDAADGPVFWRTGFPAACETVRTVDLSLRRFNDAAVWRVYCQQDCAGAGWPGVFRLDQHLQPVHRFHFLERTG
ncbi:hypothetical protein D3C87_1580310 [compost metagenome]